jgi:hypothetical protein
MRMAPSSNVCRILAPALAVLALAVPAAAQQNPFCARLEGQLAAFDRSGGDAGRADQMRRIEDAATRQQVELDKNVATSRRTGCERSGFFLFGGQPEQCGPLNAQIQQQRANIDRLHADLAQIQSTVAPERDAQRRTILAALSQNNCGPQYRAAAAAPPPSRGGLFESLFGPSSSPEASPPPIAPGDLPPDASGGYRTVCVRTCDGFYYPVSFSTPQSRLRDDEKVCQRTCPAAEVQLYSYRNPGETINQAVSLGGQPYTSLPNAFKYRQSFDKSCSCRAPGQSWAQALKGIDDTSVERGDIVVNEQRAKQLSAPRSDAQGRPIRTAPSAARPAPRADAAPAAAPADGAATPARTVRPVGPTFIPAR